MKRTIGILFILAISQNTKGMETCERIKNIHRPWDPIIEKKSKKPIPKTTISTRNSQKSTIKNKELKGRNKNSNEIFTTPKIPLEKIIDIWQLKVLMQKKENFFERECEKSKLKMLILQCLWPSDGRELYISPSFTEKIIEDYEKINQDIKCQIIALRTGTIRPRSAKGGRPQSKNFNAQKIKSRPRSKSFDAQKIKK